LANVENLPAFLPVSQLASLHYPQVKDSDKAKILQELQKFIGQEFEVKILEFIPREEKLVLSEKAKEFENINDILKNHKEGDIVEGTVSKIVNFGVFIKFPSKVSDADKENAPKEIEGLIHISELDWEMVDDPNKLFKVEQKIKAQINKIAQGKISLSVKALKPNPWEKVDKEYKKGDKVKGEIARINPFGVLVKLPSKIQGLCHISEFDSKEQMEEKMKISQTYDFEILSVEIKEHKILLKPILK
jgi:ribosomal protein S1